VGGRRVVVPIAGEGRLALGPLLLLGLAARLLLGAERPLVRLLDRDRLQVGAGDDVLLLLLGWFGGPGLLGLGGIGIRRFATLFAIGLRVLGLASGGLIVGRLCRRLIGGGLLRLGGGLLRLGGGLLRLGGLRLLGGCLL
jgi:hypothetical protein